MSHLPTNNTRLHGPYTITTCAYCSAKIKFLSSLARLDELKLKCKACGRRCLVKTADPTTSSRLTVFLPAETINSTLRQFNVLVDSKVFFNAALVSRFWNACATPILYGERNFSWDSHMKPLLGARPYLLSLIRTLRTDYLRLVPWVKEHRNDYDLQSISNKEQRRVRAAEQEVKRERDVVRSALGVDGRDVSPGIHVAMSSREMNAASKVAAKPGWLEEVRRRGAGDWMDLDDGEEPPRREGALALVTLASRCPGLQYLSLTEIDFGVVPRETLGALPTIDSLEQLTLRKVEPPAQRAVLSATPHLQRLLIEHCPIGAHVDPSTKSVSCLVLAVPRDPRTS